MVTRPARFLRMGPAADPTDKIPHSGEIEVRRTHLEIEQLRYADPQVRIMVEPELGNAGLPTLISRPVVENAAKSGVAGAPPPASIRIRGWSQDDRSFRDFVGGGTGKGRSELISGRIEGGSFRVRPGFLLER